MATSAIVLAGGRSSRFGRDKLAEPLDGTPVLWRTIEAVRTVAVDVVIVVAPGAERALPAGVRIARDATEGQGPLAGVLAGLEAVEHDAVIVVGGDMPWQRSDVLRSMLLGLDGSADAVALEVEGRAQQMPLVLRRGAALSAARGLVESGERRLGALVEHLDVATIAEVEWRTIDPGGDSVRDIDIPPDLGPA